MTHEAKNAHTLLSLLREARHNLATMSWTKHAYMRDPLGYKTEAIPLDEKRNCQVCALGAVMVALGPTPRGYYEVPEQTGERREMFRRAARALSVAVLVTAKSARDNVCDIISCNDFYHGKPGGKEKVLAVFDHAIGDMQYQKQQWAKRAADATRAE